MCLQNILQMIDVISAMFQGETKMPKTCSKAKAAEGATRQQLKVDDP